ncbi:hypothetical protein PR048_025231 [Dryococelus australis]|uniref:Uncharacterized protein n=1 Tax=Dryococelus australis TaxID=614101 RepID=A0ABQ9GQT7_9NEOP|nr:hypothetical protein PR048_025231 [Dryococelus australis]
MTCLALIVFSGHTFSLRRFVRKFEDGVDTAPLRATQIPQYTLQHTSLEPDGELHSVADNSYKGAMCGKRLIPVFAVRKPLLRQIKRSQAWLEASYENTREASSRANIISPLPPVRIELTTPGVQDQCSATELKRLAFFPPRGTRFDSRHLEIVPDPPFSPPSHLGADPYPACFTLIGSQHLDKWKTRRASRESPLPLHEGVALFSSAATAVESGWARAAPRIGRQATVLASPSQGAAGPFFKYRDGAIHPPVGTGPGSSLPYTGRREIVCGQKEEGSDWAEAKHCVSTPTSYMFIRLIAAGRLGTQEGRYFRAQSLSCGFYARADETNTLLCRTNFRKAVSLSLPAILPLRPPNRWGERDQALLSQVYQLSTLVDRIQNPNPIHKYLPQGFTLPQYPQYKVPSGTDAGLSKPPLQMSVGKVMTGFQTGEKSFPELHSCSANVEILHHVHQTLPLPSTTAAVATNSTCLGLIADIAHINKVSCRTSAKVTPSPWELHFPHHPFAYSWAITWSIIENILDTDRINELFQMDRRWASRDIARDLHISHNTRYIIHNCCNVSGLSGAITAIVVMDTPRKKKGLDGRAQQTSAERKGHWEKPLLANSLPTPLLQTEVTTRDPRSIIVYGRVLKKRVGISTEIEGQSESKVDKVMATVFRDAQGQRRGAIAARSRTLNVRQDLQQPVASVRHPAVRHTLSPSRAIPNQTSYVRQSVRERERERAKREDLEVTPLVCRRGHWVCTSAAASYRTDSPERTRYRLFTIKDEGLGRNWPCSGVISGNHGKLKLGWLDQKSNPGPPECESRTALPLTTDSTSPGGAKRTRPLRAGIAEVGAEPEPRQNPQPVVLLSQNWLSEHQTPRRPWFEVQTKKSSFTGPSFLPGSSNCLRSLRDTVSTNYDVYSRDKRCRVAKIKTVKPNSFGAAVAELLNCSPSTKANMGLSPTGSLPIFSQVGIVPVNAAGRRVFSRISRFAPPPHSGAAPYSPHFTIIGSQDLVAGTTRTCYGGKCYVFHNCQLNGVMCVSLRILNDFQQAHEIARDSSRKHSEKKGEKERERERGRILFTLQNFRKHGGAPEYKGGVNGIFLRKPADQHHTPARFSQAKIRERPPEGIKPEPPALQIGGAPTDWSHWRSAINGIESVARYECAPNITNLLCSAAPLLGCLGNLPASYSFPYLWIPSYRPFTVKYTQCDENTARQFRALRVGAMVHLMQWQNRPYRPYRSRASRPQAPKMGPVSKPMIGIKDKSPTSAPCGLKLQPRLLSVNVVSLIRVKAGRARGTPEVRYADLAFHDRYCHHREVSMEQCRNARAEETGNPRGNSPKQRHRQARFPVTTRESNPVRHG